MPPTTRAKRKLAETDGNAHIAPEPKRASPTSSPKDVSKENEDPGVRLMINTETAKPAAEKIATDITAITDAITTPSEVGEGERATPNDPSRHWICVCRPEAVRRKEQASEAIRTRELLHSSPYNNRLLKTRDLFKPQSSTIRNVGLTLAMFIKFAHTFQE
ncbi:MAG: hypothetical protein Q9198_002665 [Flavoplaca austrocitrina]